MPSPGDISRISFLASSAALAQDSRARLAARYGDVAPENAQVIVALGGGWVHAGNPPPHARPGGWRSMG